MLSRDFIRIAGWIQSNNQCPQTNRLDIQTPRDQGSKIDFVIICNFQCPLANGVLAIQIEQVSFGQKATCISLCAGASYGAIENTCSSSIVKSGASHHSAVAENIRHKLYPGARRANKEDIEVTEESMGQAERDVDICNPRGLLWNIDSGRRLVSIQNCFR